MDSQKIDLIVQGIDKANSVQSLKTSIKEINKAIREVGDRSPEDLKKLNRALVDAKEKSDDLSDSFKQLRGSGVEQLKASFGNLTDSLINADFDKAKIGFQGIKSAMSAIPIFLLIQGAQLLFENFDKVVDLFKDFFGNGEQVKAFAATFDRVTESIDDSGKALDRLNQMFETRNAIIIEKAKQRGATEAELDKISLGQKKALIARTTEAYEEAYDKRYKFEKEFNEKSDDLSEDDFKKAQETLRKLYDEQQKYHDKVYDLKANQALTEEQIATKAYEKQKELNQKAYEERKKQSEKLAADEKKVEEDLEMQKAGSEEKKLQIAAERQIKELQREYDKSLKTKADQQNLADAISEINEKLALDIKVITDKKAADDAAKAEAARVAEEKRVNNIIANNQKVTNAAVDELLKREDQLNQIELESIQNNDLAKLELQQQQLGEMRQLELDAAELTGADKQAILNKYALQELQLQNKVTAEKKKLAQQETQNTISTAANGLKAVQGLSDLYFNIKMANVKKGSAEEEKAARKQFKINKALQLTGAIIDGAKAITSSLAQSPIAIGPVPNPAGIASLAAAVASSAASIAKIASTQYESSATTADAPTAPSPTDGGGGSSPTISAPATTFTRAAQAADGIQFSTTAQTLSTNIAGVEGAQQRQDNGPIRVYVLEEDITGAQNRVKVAEEKGTF